MGHERDQPVSADAARVTVVVKAAPERAFRIFTEEIDLWWRRGPRFRSFTAERGLIHIEPGQGGRVFESVTEGGEERVFEIGRNLDWDPPRRLVFEWRIRNFQPHEKTVVEVLFEALRNGTRVTVTHSGWSQIRPDHPARHGLASPAFLRMMGLWWADLLTGLRERTAAYEVARARD
jgi:uncharacterized protein YndB with AHSA1/START domain